MLSKRRRFVSRPCEEVGEVRGNVRTPPRLISARQGIRVRGIVMRRRFVSRPWEEVGGVRSNVRAPPRLISVRQGIGVRGISKRRRFVSRPWCFGALSRCTHVAGRHQALGRGPEVLSAFQISLGPVARAGPRPVSGHLQQGLTGPDSGSNQLQRKGLPRCWGTSSKVLNSYLSQSEGEGLPPVSGLRMCGTPTDWCRAPGLNHTRTEWGEVALEIGNKEQFMPGDIEGQEMPPMVGQE